MFLKHKLMPDGSYDKTKARLVGNGANQKDHMYDLVSSSTVALSSVFLVLNIASFNRTKVTTYDIKGAFLHASFEPADEVTYIRINKETAAIWCELDPSAGPFLDQQGTLVLELDKFIYGLKQSPLKFQQHLRSRLISMGYMPLVQDECLYVKHEGSDYSVISIHVDDILQTATSQKLYDELKDGLLLEYKEITTTENGTAYLGMTIRQSEKDKRFINLSQQGMIDKLVLENPRTASDQQKYYSPSSDDLSDVDVREGTSELNQKDKSAFLSVLMTMMYLARLTRPDILMPVTFLASRTHCATSDDARKLQRIIRYLEVSDNPGVIINCEALDIRCNCDASYSTHVPNARGHTGFIVSMGPTNSYVHARSGKQKVGSTSSTDAEVIGLVEACKFCYWMRSVLTELHITALSMIKMVQDNKSVIMMTEGYTNMKHSKHLLSKMDFIISMRERKMLDIAYLATGEMTSDVLSKALHGTLFHKHIWNMMGLMWRRYFWKITAGVTAEDIRTEEFTEAGVGSKRSRNNHSRTNRAVKRTGLGTQDTSNASRK